jgi:hypothetical protein
MKSAMTACGPLLLAGRPDCRAPVGSNRRWTGHGASIMNAPQMTQSGHSSKCWVVSLISATVEPPPRPLTIAEIAEMFPLDAGGVDDRSPFLDLSAFNAEIID